MTLSAKRNVVTASLLFTILSLTASAVNFAFYPVLAHLLSAAEYGVVQIGVSFVMLAAALFTSLNALALYVSARDTVPGSGLALVPIERMVVAASLVLAVVMVVAAAPLAHFLALSDPSLMYVLAAIFVINVPASTWLGALQGSGQFALSGWIGVAAATTKIAAAVALVFVGLGAHGALAGLLLGTFAVLPLAKLAQHRVSLSFRRTFRLPSRSDLAYFAAHKDLGVVLVALMCLAIIGSLDMVVAKATLSPTVAGDYAKASTAGKIPYYALVPVATVLFERFVRSGVSVRRYVVGFFGLATALALVVWLARDLVLGLVFGAVSAASTEPFTPLLIGFTAFAAAMLAAFRLVASGRSGTLLVLAAGSLAAVVVGLSVAPRTPDGIGSGFAVAACAGAIALSVVAYTPAHERAQA